VDVTDTVVLLVVVAFDAAPPVISNTGIDVDDLVICDMLDPVDVTVSFEGRVEVDVLVCWPEGEM
jgi:hypothetical protein